MELPSGKSYTDLRAQASGQTETLFSLSGANKIVGQERERETEKETQRHRDTETQRDREVGTRSRWPVPTTSRRERAAQDTNDEMELQKVDFFLSATQNLICSCQIGKNARAGKFHFILPTRAR
jgi:hypothetical protein